MVGALRRRRAQQAVGRHLWLAVSTLALAAAVDLGWRGHHFQLSVEEVAALVEAPRISHPVWSMQWEQAGKPEVLVCSVVLFVFGVLCSAAGIGGGGVYVAALVAAGGLPLHDAVPLSKAVVFFGAVASLLVNVRKMSAPEGSVIDLDVCKAVVPAALIGTFLGVLLNAESKDITILCVLSVLLIAMTAAVFRTAWRQRQEELAVERQGAAGGLLAGPAGPPRPEALPQALGLAAAGKLAPQLPTGEEIVLVMWTLLVVIVSGILHFHIKRCHQDHLDAVGLDAASSCQHPIVLTLFNGRFEAYMRDAQTALFFQALAFSAPTFACGSLAGYYALDVRRRARWPLPKLLGYQAVSLLTGLLAGLVGIGGGLIFAPFFLLTGMDPVIAVGTSSTCVLFTSSSTTAQYLFTDRIIMSLALVYGVVALAASSSGTALVHGLRLHFPLRKSYITWIVALSVAVSVALVLAKALAVVGAAVHAAPAPAAAA